MRKTLFVTILVLACAFAAMAQDAPKAQVFGGYQWTSVDVFGQKRVNLNGWNGALDGYFNKNFGITADFAGAYGKPDTGDLAGKLDTKIHTFMFGPTVRMPGEKINVFAHALFGAAHASIAPEGFSAATDTSFAYAFGGGVDLNASKKFAIRIGQFDYFGTRFNSDKITDGGIVDKNNQNHFRYSAGVVFKF